MMITGHKTRSVFDRYDIVSCTDLQEAARRIDNAITEPALSPMLPSHRPLFSLDGDKFGYNALAPVSSALEEAS